MKKELGSCLTPAHSNCVASSSRIRNLLLATFVLCNVLVQAADSKMCVDKGNGNDFTCAVGPLPIRRVAGSTEKVDMGVQQRIDGSDSEKNSIKEVLSRMDEYFVKEVLSMPVYEGVRSKCKNTNELCAFWSSVGECESNRVFMLSNCAAACRFCLLLNTNIG